MALPLQEICSMPEVQESQLKVVSWNIWFGQHFSEILEHLDASHPDIIGLQEVIKKPGEKHDMAKKIAQELELPGYVFYPAFKHDSGDIQGNAIISRFPLEQPREHLLSGADLYRGSAETQPRVAVEAIITTNRRDVKFLTTHLAYSYKFRESPIRALQVDSLLKIIDEDSLILTGDFNSPAGTSTVDRVAAVIPNTDPTDEPTWTIYPFDNDGHVETEVKHRLDYIFATPDFEVVGSGTEQTTGSDHLPVYAVLAA
jgi:endonuclease/exonuclease/phosphatase family metal-dependent hydrolase